MRMPSDGESSGGLRVHVAATAKEAADNACDGAVSLLASLLDTQPVVRVMFAAALSQMEFLARIRRKPGIAWSRIEAFQLDEYVGLPAGHPASFAEWLRTRLFDLVHPGTVFELDSAAANPDVECERYSARIAEAPIDVAFVGIGENGHLAFNEPGVADFDDRRLARVVDLDSASRMQQVHDGAFARLESVPEVAMTVTIPAIMQVRHLALLATGPRKTRAVQTMIHGSISESCPATILRRHADVTVYLDREAAPGSV
jgi:glucosamine-6-phosphate deaminase